MTSRGPWIDTFEGNFQWSNATLVVKGMAPYGVVALQEIDRCCDRLRARQSEPHAWQEEWTALGDGIERQARALVGEGRSVTAGDYFLRAGIYLYSAERFILPGAAKRALGLRAYAAWHEGIRRRYPQVEFVEVPYQGVGLPALFMPAQGAAGPAPSVVVVNGMDNAKEMSIFFAGLDFARRGFNVLCMDGPGQGETMRVRGMPSRYDYEVPGAAAYDYLAGRADVDPGRICIMGYSFGGYYSSRIAACDKRYAAGIALTALHWDLAGWQTRIKERNKAAPGSVAQSNFQFQWVVGAGSEDEAIEIARKFSLADVARNISCPFLVTHGANDRVVPVDNAPRLFEAVGAKNKTIKIFTAEDGGAEHAHVDNRPVGIAYAADWLAANM